MNLLNLILLLILAFRASKTETLDNNEKEKPNREEVLTFLDYEEDYKEDRADDVAGRQLQPIELYTNDRRCSSIGVCSGMDYGDKNVVVTFDVKQEVRITSGTTYELENPPDYKSLTFIDSKFANFPLQLFYAFKIEELDFRNCSLETLKWDNFLKAEKLMILLLSENLLTEINPSLFSLAENLSFLFLDSNLIKVLHNESFKGLDKLNYLDLHNNLIETLPSDIFSYLPLVQQINLAENRLKIIDEFLFERNSHLFGLHLQHNSLNEVKDYAFKNQRHLTYLDFSHNLDLKVLVLVNVKVENLWAQNCSLQRINIYGEAVHVDLQQNIIKELYFSQPEYLETLRLKDNALEQISSLSQSTNLKMLDVSNNPGLKVLPDVFKINSLERLDLSNTSLKEIPASVMTSPKKLRSLNVSYNQIEEINPSNFKYLVRLTQFYIHHNNWNCYNLQMLMDMVIQPLKISYMLDAYEKDFVGEYIGGIKCMYRLEQSDEEYYVDSMGSKKLEQHQEKLSEINAAADDITEVEELRREFKAIIGIYEDKFSVVWNKLNDLDLRLKEFELFNSSTWKEVAIIV